MYSEDHAKVWINFFEKRLTHTKGIYARQPFLLPPWQRQIVGDIFGTIRDDGYRQYQTAYIEVPKKNGKSELAAGIALGGLLIDNEPGAEIYSAAATRDQASIVFKVAAQMVRNSERLSKLVRILDSTKTIVLRDDPSSFYKAISADAGTQDGINPHMVVFDELHRQKDRDLWEVLTMGSDTRMQPLTFAITTAGIYGESPLCWDQHEYARQILEGVIHDPSFYPVIFSMADDEDWTFEGEPAQGDRPATGWYKVNPALGDFLRVEKVREAIKKAIQVPSEQNGIRRLRFNQWTSSATRWLDLASWDTCKAPFNPQDLIGRHCIGGLDLSGTTDITAFVLLFQIGQEVFILPTFWIPEHNLHQRSIKDKVPYEHWVAMGLVHTTPGNLIDYGFIRKHINQLKDLYNIGEIGADPWNATQLLTNLTDDGFTIVPTRQSMGVMSPPSKELERLVLASHFRHGGNPVLRWMMDCTSVKQDADGNIKPIKPDRLKSSKRIDGIVATINGLSRIIANQAPPQVSVFAV